MKFIRCYILYHLYLQHNWKTEILTQIFASLTSVLTYISLHNSALYHIQCFTSGLGTDVSCQCPFLLLSFHINQGLQEISAI